MNYLVKEAIKLALLAGLSHAKHMLRSTMDKKMK